MILGVYMEEVWGGYEDWGGGGGKGIMGERVRG